MEKIHVLETIPPERCEIAIDLIGKSKMLTGEEINRQDKRVWGERETKKIATKKIEDEEQQMALNRF